MQGPFPRQMHEMYKKRNRNGEFFLSLRNPLDMLVDDRHIMLIRDDNLIYCGKGSLWIEKTSFRFSRIIVQIHVLIPQL
jgi:hypothetical protein